MSNLLQDFRYVVRGLRNSPLFTSVAVITLALGIGAATTLFTIVDAVLLRPLPYADAGHLLSVSEFVRGEDRHVVGSPNIVAWTESTHTISAIAAYGSSSITLTGSGEPVQLNGARVTPGFFRLLGLRAALGRTLQPSDDVAGAPDIVVLSHALWQDRFAADPAIVGRSITLSGKPYTVVGVLGPGPSLPGIAMLWMPLHLFQATPPGTFYYYSVLVRPRPGVAMPAVQRELVSLVRRADSARPVGLRGAGVLVMTLHDRMFGSVQRPLVLLFGMVGLLLLIACANVANLLLARSASRRREMAVRVALGAGRGRLARQVMLESVVLALAGAVAGVLIPVWAVSAFVHLSPDVIARVNNVQVNVRVLAFATAIGLVSGLLFGAIPAWFGARENALEGLKEGGARVGGGRGDQRLRRVLVIGELAIALVLLTGAGLLGRSFLKVLAVDLGFRPQHLVAAWINLPRARYPEQAPQDAFFDELVGRLRAIPGVESVALTDVVPPNGLSMSVAASAFTGRPDDAAQVAVVTASSEFPRTVGLQLLRGRVFDPTDRSGTPPSAIVSASAARLLFPGSGAVGQTISAAGVTSPAQRATVVGVVKDVPALGVDAVPIPHVYFAREQVGGGQSVVVVRGNVDPGAMRTMMQHTVAAIDPLQPLASFERIDETLDRSVAPHRLGFLLVGAFAGLALLLSAVGLYGVMAYQVAQRTREMGIRVALGATSGAVRALIVGQGVRLILAGCAAGILLSFGLSRLLAGLLYGVGVRDWASFTLAPLLLTVVGSAACYFPTRRATAVDPMIALRNE